MLTSFLFAALTINSDQHKLIDIQESPNVQTDNHDPNNNHQVDPDDMQPISLTQRRHSLQDDHINNNFFEQQFAQHMQTCENDNDWDENETPHQKNKRRFHANALNWLRHFNIMRDKCPYDTISQRRFKTNLRKTSSENEILLMSPSNDPNLTELPAIRRSFSSGLLFAI